MSESKFALENRPQYEVAALQARDAFIKVAGKEEIFIKEVMFAMQILRGNTLLQKCGEKSIQDAVINVALTGATLNPVVGQAYLVPRGGKCCLDFSYRGLAGIAMDSGSVKHIGPRLVYSFDDFDFEEVDGVPHVRHKPCLNPPEEFAEGPVKFWDFLVCGYVVAILADDTRIITQPLPKWKLHKAMKTSKTVKDGTPWRTHPDELCLKTLVKHAYKLLPQTDRMSTAVAVINEHEGLAKEAPAAKSLMDRFTAPAEEADIVDAPPACEFCALPDGRHEEKCPDNLEGMP